MGLPVIGAYPMPDRSTLPASSVPWTVDPARAALLVHDMQNHFVRAFPAGRSPVVELVDNIAALRELARTLGMPVVFSAEPAAQEPGRRGLLADVWGPGIGDGSDAAAIVAPLTPRPGEHLLANVRHNAFLRSHLGRLLRSQGRDQLIVCGVYAHLGVLLTAADAFMNDIQPFVVADAVADFSAEEHSMALRWAARSGVVCTTDGLLRDLAAGRPAEGA
ncbi:isochorismatase family protein [Streptomyces sp. WAC05374]|uniref:isochorismatase family protein n=1 Tax=Streptomyces sp. WAC05374 TaxID=2487420 RepID=UPI000F886094|nr:isochorismatase family protein [Streptomyces sp. WAC05374]RST12731.1 isochorismatase family protein [Streptomyces sp. WAC05374]TDF50545.1 isochorismatase family protein [Streptomyces sp. WAC05374]TDF56834.1 isochorismatase family protein [Streptomyces sp. WAC05374]TDF60797.1 isochorismatase family protein [Streptomyces sp. WAC05374]